MNGKTHFFIGLCVGVGTSIYTDVPANEAVILTTIASISAILPDVDHPNALINKLLPIKLSLIFGHRGFTHSLVALLLLVVGCVYINMPVMYTAMIAGGYGSHIIADMLTIAGVPVLWPIRFRWSLSPMRLLK